jgi:hypothetical protein
MPVDRLLRILTRLSEDRDAASSAIGLPNACAAIAVMTGATITVGDEAGAPGAVYSSDLLSATLADLELTLGEGPGVDAQRLQLFVAEPDLARPIEGRWPTYAPLADAAGAHAVFAVPVGIGPNHVGGLTFYRDLPGPLTDDQHADVLVLGEVTAKALLGFQEQISDGGGPSELEDLTSYRAVVHQASGMLAVQLAVSVAEGLARLRGHAYAHDLTLSAGATEVVARRLRLQPEGSE